MTIDLDALEKEVTEYPDDATCNREIIELIQRLREAERDAERMQWCIETMRFPQFCSHTNTGRGCGWYMPDSEIEYAEARAAIDQQRKIATGEDIGL